MSEQPTVWASIGQTINLGNYENVKIDIGLSGIPVDCTEEYLDEQLASAGDTLKKIVFKLAEELQKRAKEVRG